MESHITLAAKEPNIFAEFRAIVRKVDTAKPTADDVAALGAFFHLHPHFWRLSGDLAEQAAMRLISDMKAPRSMKEGMKAGCAAIAAELTQSGDGALEGLLIRQIVAEWVRMAYIEYMFNAELGSSETTFKRLDFWERQLSAAQRRYLRACETLARVRRLGVPALQVNIAERQLNQVTTRG